MSGHKTKLVAPGTMVCALLSVLLLSFPSVALAKDKAAVAPSPADIVWLNGGEVKALFEGGVWCAKPEGDTCTFISTSLGVEGNIVSYEIRGIWEDDEVYSLIYHAEVADDGMLCEPTTLNIKGLSASDFDGNPLSRIRMEEIRTQFIQIFADSTEEFSCFGYANNAPKHGYQISQYGIDAEFNASSITIFDIFYTADAAEHIHLRAH